MMMIPPDGAGRADYEPPIVTVLGSVADLTQAKAGSNADGSSGGFKSK
jgi:hypothetical protein